MKLMMLITALTLFFSCVPEVNKSIEADPIVDQGFTLEEISKNTTLFELLDMDFKLEKIAELKQNDKGDEALKMISELESFAQSLPLNCTIVQFHTLIDSNSAATLFESEIIIGETYRVNVVQDVPTEEGIQTAKIATFNHLFSLKEQQVCSNSGICEVSIKDQDSYDSKSDSIITTTARVVSFPVSTRTFAAKGAALDSEKTELVINSDEELGVFLTLAKNIGFCQKIVTTEK